MKKILSSLLVCVLLIASLFALASCGDKDKTLSGTYEGNGLTLKFKGETVTVAITDLAVRYELRGEYDIDDKKGKLSIEFSFKDLDEASEEEAKVLLELEKFGNVFDSTQPFEDNGKNIKIGLLTFTKK